MRPKANIYLGDYDLFRFTRGGGTCYFCPSLLGGSPLTTRLVTANYLFAALFFLPRNFIFDRLAFNVTAAGAAGTKGRGGIYLNNISIFLGSLYPGRLIYDAGEQAVDTTGVKETAPAAPITLSGGLAYWIAFISSGAPTLRSLPTANREARFIGWSSTLGTVPSSAVYHAQTYGALPDPFPSAGPVVDASDSMGIFLRKM